MNFLKNKTILLLIFLFAVLIRPSGINQVLFGDELFYAETAKDLEFINYYGSHPPLSFWLHGVWSFLIGAAVWKSRLLVALFSLANIFLTYYLGKKYFDEKTGILAAFLLTSSAWFTSGSLQLDMDASFVSFFFLITVYFYTKFIENKENKFLFLTGLFYGLGILTKYTLVLIGPTLVIHHLFKERKEKFWKYFFKTFLIIFGVAFLVFLIFPIFGFATDSSSFYASFSHAFDLLAGKTNEQVMKEGVNYFLLTIQFANALLWMSPLMIGALFYHLFYSKRRNNLFLIWILIISVFYIFIIKDNFRPVEKYLLIIAPALSILGGEFLSKIKFNRKRILILFTSSISWFIFLIFFNLQKGVLLNFYPKIKFLEEALKFNLLLNLPLEGHAGPIGFYILFGTAVLTFIVCFLLFVASVLTRKLTFSTYFVLLFFGISIGYNLYLSEEQFFGIAKPNINKASGEIIDYLLKENYENSTLPIFIFRNIGFEYYLENKLGKSRDNIGNPCNTYANISCLNYAKTYYLDFKDEFDNSTINIIKERKPYVAVIDYPQINKKSDLWQMFEKCIKLKTFSDKNINLGYVFRC